MRYKRKYDIWDQLRQEELRKRYHKQVAFKLVLVVLFILTLVLVLSSV